MNRATRSPDRRSRCEEQGEAGSEKRDRIDGADAEQKRHEQPRQQRCAAGADGDADADERGTLADDMPNDDRRAQAQCDANCPITPASCGEVSDDAVDPHGAEHEGQRREEREECHDLPRRADGRIEDALHRCRALHRVSRRDTLHAAARGLE